MMEHFQHRCLQFRSLCFQYKLFEKGSNVISLFGRNLKFELAKVSVARRHFGPNKIFA